MEYIQATNMSPPQKRKFCHGKTIPQIKFLKNNCSEFASSPSFWRDTMLWYHLVHFQGFPVFEVYGLFIQWALLSESTLKIILLTVFFPSRLLTLLPHKIKVNDKVISHILLYLLISMSNFMWIKAQVSWVTSLNKWFLQNLHCSSFNTPSVLDFHLFFLPERKRIFEGHCWWANRLESIPRIEMQGVGFPPRKEISIHVTLLKIKRTHTLKPKASPGLFELSVLWNGQGVFGNKTCPMRTGRITSYFHLESTSEPKS